jgi:histidinol phosphatase-like PHP family hydrolase
VAPGTNRAAVESSAVNLLAHPGFLSAEEAQLAAQRGCYIEITTRKGHSLTNGLVARMCRQAGAPMLVNSDAHAPGDLPTLSFAQAVARGAGLDEAEVQDACVTQPQALLRRILDARR